MKCPQLSEIATEHHTFFYNNTSDTRVRGVTGMYLQMAYKALMESRSPYDTISVSGHEGLSVELTLSLEFKVQA